MYLQEVLHLSPLAAGLVIASQGVIGLATGLLGARPARRLGIERVLVVTGLAATVGFAVLTQLPLGGGCRTPLAAVMLVGFGTAGMAFGSRVTASAGMAGGDQGLVGGVINTSRRLGAALGAALLPTVADAVDRSSHTSLAVGDRAAILAGGAGDRARHAGGTERPAKVTPRSGARLTPHRPSGLCVLSSPAQRRRSGCSTAQRRPPVRHGER